MPPCLTLSIIRYGSRVKWSNPGKGVVPSPTHWSIEKGAFRSTTLLYLQFQYQKQFHFQQFSLALVHSLNIKTLLFQAIQFSLSAQFSSVWSIDKTLSGATTLGQSGPRAMAMKEYSAFLKAPALLEPHHQIILCNIQDTRWRGLLPHTQIYSRSILEPKPTGQERK